MLPSPMGRSTALYVELRTRELHDAAAAERAGRASGARRSGRASGARRSGLLGRIRRRLAGHAAPLALPIDEPAPGVPVPPDLSGSGRSPRVAVRPAARSPTCVAEPDPRRQG